VVVFPFTMTVIASLLIIKGSVICQLLLCLARVYKIT